MNLEGIMPADFQITTEILYRGALLFALLDAVYIPLLVWRVNKEAFRRLKWMLPISAAFVWYGIWSWAIGNYWESVYFYVFPAWSRIWIPEIAFVVAGIVTFVLQAWSLRLKWNVVLSYCLLGGALGSLTHTWAVSRGIVANPPMLQGASPVAAIIIAFFEYIFYWCVILTFAKMMDWIVGTLKNPVPSRV